MSQSIPIVQIRNFDFPYWDYCYLTAGAAEQSYPVGQNNVATGAIHKYFVSRVTLFYADAETFVRLNDARSIQMRIPANILITFTTNIYAIFVQRPGGADTHIYCYFEGVEPEEARNAQ